MPSSPNHANKKECIYVYEVDTRKIKKDENNGGAKVIIDSGSPNTIAGVNWARKYFRSIPEAIRLNITIEKPDQKFEFGGGERRNSLGVITIPAYVLDDEYQAHMIMIGVDIVDAKIPMLFGAKSLDRAEAVMKFGKDSYLASVLLSCCYVIMKYDSGVCGNSVHTIGGGGVGRGPIVI